MFHVIQIFLVRQNVIQSWRIWWVEEGIWLRDRAKAFISTPVLSPVWPLTHPECNRKSLGLGSGVLSTRAAAEQAEFKL